MRLVFNKRYWLAAAVAAVLGLAVGTVAAHEGREVGDYRVNVGWIVEPAYEGFPNGVEVRVIKVAESVAMITTASPRRRLTTIITATRGR